MNIPLPKLVRKIDNSKMELTRDKRETVTREQIAQRIADFQLRIDRLRAILAKFDAQ